MATVSKWSPFGVALDITATGGTVTRTSATKYTVVINASWETYYSGAQTNYGMSATSGGVTKTISSFGTKRSSGSGSFTGTYTISGNGSATKTITVTFKNYEEDWQGNITESATKNVTFNVTVPAWTSYKITYNANGGSGAPSSQTKWKDQTLTLSSTKPTRTGYSFQGWATSSSATSATYSAGGSYTANAAATLYAVWKANTYTVKYNANGGSGAPANQTKTYGKTLTLSSTKPTRANYNFKGWGTSASATTVAYAAGASYTANAAVTLYAIWELAYTKPRISNITVSRCDSAGTVTESGTYAKVSCSFACDKAVSSIEIDWYSKASGAGAVRIPVPDGTTSSTINEIVGDGALSFNAPYTITITVTDAGGSSEAKRTLRSKKFLVNCLPENRGIAFGKMAELEDTAEFAFVIIGTHGELINSPIELTEGYNLNDLLTEGHYIIGSTAISATILNKPLWVGESDNSTAYIKVGRMGDGMQKYQRYYWCSKTNQLIFQRVYYSNSWGEWAIVGGCTSWRNLTVASGFENYSASDAPKYRVNGNLVTVTGAVKPTAAVTSSTTGVNIASGIDKAFCPARSTQFVCQGSAINRWALTISPSGVLSVARYGRENYVDISAGSWLTFCVTYSI